MPPNKAMKNCLAALRAYDEARWLELSGSADDRPTFNPAPETYRFISQNDDDLWSSDDGDQDYKPDPEILPNAQDSPSTADVDDDFASKDDDETPSNADEQGGQDGLTGSLGSRLFDSSSSEDDSSSDSSTPSIFASPSLALHSARPPITILVGGNLAFTQSPPYTTPASSVWESQFWSPSLLRHGIFTPRDAALLRLTMDCALKLFARQDHDIAALKAQHEDDPDLPWIILDLVCKECTHFQDEDCSEEDADGLTTSPEFFLESIGASLAMVRERCFVWIRQDVLRPQSRGDWEREGWFGWWEEMQEATVRAFDWTYRDGDVEGDEGGRGGVLVREWVFEHN